MNNYTATAFSREAMSRLRGLIARFDINQADLAVLCDVSQSQFSKMVRGLRPMSVDQLAVTLEALGQDIGKFVTEIESFLANRAEYSSPIQYVIDDEREVDAAPFSDSMLDGWGRAARARLVPSDVSGRDDDVEEMSEYQADYGRAARKRSKDRGYDIDYHDHED
ncbi:hypothetical protein GCM10010910_00910 [Microbacterium nanhaiense]|uniref:HTH cro/C1-type domain-containing protein n=1 Tax=Microbacterium nanhaiense TaxID=1301026 RepID=A0ABQ2MVC7_9MICO|nr:XRE family transcriptional regulator [Microbacterium nanhaiense]GGO59003.1 hypothetical protein GCM10010910_00910 [Microbacterium nanhaiense]